jgi:hypothetical protein
MGMVKVAVHQIVHVIAVGNRLVTTAFSVLVVCIVGVTLVSGRAVRRIGRRELDRVLIDVVAMGVVHMPIVEVVRVSVVLNGLVTASRTVNVVVRSMDIAVGHQFFS